MGDVLQLVEEDFVDYVFRMLRHGVALKSITQSLGISSPRQLKKFMTDALGYEFVLYEQLTIEEVCEKIERYLPIHEQGRNWGIRQVKVALARLDIRVTRSKVAAALQSISGAQYARRRSTRLIHRRQYNVTVPMALWHIDSYDKLAMYGFGVHAAIDGASHYVLWAQVAPNKTKEVIYEPFRLAVQKFGVPLRVRSDFASEHVLIKQYMETARPNHPRNPFLVGSSVHNQRIEHWWRQLWERVVWFFKLMIANMITAGIYDSDDAYQRHSFIVVYTPILQAAVTEYIQIWNSHRVRRINEAGRDRPSHVPAIIFQEFERLHGRRDLQLEDEHQFQDDLQNIGTGDPGPRGNLQYRVDHRPHDTIYAIPDLHPHSAALRDRAYDLGKLGKSPESCFHLHYFLSHYCHVGQAERIQLIDLPVIEHSPESIEAHQLLLELLTQ